MGAFLECRVGRAHLHGLVGPVCGSLTRGLIYSRASYQVVKCCLLEAGSKVDGFGKGCRMHWRKERQVDH